ncbi:hypothetical protein BGX26_004666, partial [Mortierella sp. AD094]
VTQATAFVRLYGRLKDSEFQLWKTDISYDEDDDTVPGKIVRWVYELFGEQESIKVEGNKDLEALLSELANDLSSKISRLNDTVVQAALTMEGIAINFE